MPDELVRVRGPDVARRPGDDRAAGRAAGRGDLARWPGPKDYRNVLGNWGDADMADLYVNRSNFNNALLLAEQQKITDYIVRYAAEKKSGPLNQEIICGNSMGCLDGVPKDYRNVLGNWGDADMADLYLNRSNINNTLLLAEQKKITDCIVRYAAEK